jgi:hypothetical protein
MKTDTVFIRHTESVAGDFNINYIVATGSDLRVIDAHSAEHGLPKVLISEQKRGDAAVSITWPNGDYCLVHASNYALAQSTFAPRSEIVKAFKYTGE